MLFELEGEEPTEIMRGEAFWSRVARVVHYQTRTWTPPGWSRFCGLHLRSGVDMITMARTARDSIPRFIAPYPAFADTRSENDASDHRARALQQVSTGLVLEDVPYPHPPRTTSLSGYTWQGSPLVNSTGRAHGPTVPGAPGRRAIPAPRSPG